MNRLCCYTKHGSAKLVVSHLKVTYRMSAATGCRVLQPLGSAGIRRGFLKGAVRGSVQDGGIGGQHVTACFLAGGYMRLRLGGGLRRLLVLVLLGRAGVGRRSSFRNRLRGCRRLIAAVVL